MDQFLAPETDTKRQFLEPETDVKCQFLLLGPETDILCQFLEPETDIMGERNYIIRNDIWGFSTRLIPHPRTQQ